jgi:hypothetical protein
MAELLPIQSLKAATLLFASGPIAKGSFESRERMWSNQNPEISQVSQISLPTEKSSAHFIFQFLDRASESRW